MKQVDEMDAEFEQSLARANSVLDRIGNMAAPQLPQGTKRLLKVKRMLTDWEDDLLDIGTQLLFGFSLDGIDDLDDQSMADLQASLGQIQQSIDGLNNKLDSIIQELQELPNIIAGIIDNAFAKQSLVQATTYVGQIKDLTKDKATFLANQMQVAALVAELETAINETWAFTEGGVMAATLTCCATAVWAQTKARLLLDEMTNPSKYGLKDMMFYGTTKQNYQSLMTGLTQQQTSANDAYANIPNASVMNGTWTFDIGKGMYALNNLVLRPCSTQLYMLDASVGPNEPYGSAILTVGKRQTCTRFPINMNLAEPFTWVDFQNVQAAANAWPAILAVRTQYEALFAYASNSSQAFALIKQALP